ncbi:uncharacterized protein LOC123544064 [Mercenaria mercenaria]|uniref:uncharacterized protein LOC123544064 n=1 Tax=Mercenaria mercenaria TaxID=6596 RepID=UPI00234EE508|nr:uncharacterized protein LOC123544064 [Mercenaria mercenaria]
MKRKREQMTLWKAAFVNGRETFKSWIDKARMLELNSDVSSASSTHYSDLNLKSKCARMEDKFMCTFSVGIRPTSKQKRTLNQMLKVSNHAYNWSNYLVKEKDFKPKQFDLQRVVTKTNSTDVPAEYRLPGDDWSFDNKMSGIKTTACKNFCTMYKSAQTNQKKTKVDLRNKDTAMLREGSFEVQSKYVRLLTEKDIPDERIRQSRIALMPDNFSKSKKDWKERFLRLSKKVSKLPPLSHDMKVCKRPDGKFILQIPCDPICTRQIQVQTSDSICSIDPGGRTFATCYDPSNIKTFQIGPEADKKEIIHKYHEKIDQVHRLLAYAQKKKQTQAVQDRIGQLKKLHLKLKTYVDDVHLKLCSYLVKNYKLVVLGKISVSSIVRKDRPNHLAKKGNRDLLCWQHYRFRQRLLHRVRGTDCEAIAQDERYTSKTCGNCGVKNNKLGGKETFICESCNYKTHRDVNGARNILCKYLKLFPFAA